MARRTKRYIPWQVRTLRYLFLGAIILLATGLTLKPSKNTGASSTPSYADIDLLDVSLPDETPAIMCRYTGFDVSFNPSWHVPNYVVWELTAGETLGQEPRSKRFAQDSDVFGCPTPDDYRNSGFDRGHMAPAADMKWSRRAMEDCHYLTNIVPQNHSLNSGRWNTLEQKCRAWARQDSAIIIVTGPVLTDRIVRTIGRSGVAVPSRFFKVVFAPYANPPRAIGFIVPNAPVRESLAAMATTVDQVEEITGYDFFHQLPDSLENKLESTLRARDWGL